MLRFECVPKKIANLTLNSKVFEAAREMGTNPSQTVDTLLMGEVKFLYWEQWNECNKYAVE